MSSKEPAPAPLPELSDRDTLMARLNGFADPVDAAITIIVAHEASLECCTRRLAEAEAENGRFAGMLEDSVSGWRKLYTEERAERVRIEGILLNDVQAERQESDEHIAGLDTVIRTQDKTIGDLRAHIQRINVAYNDVVSRAESAEARVKELEAALADMLSGWRYIRENHGDLYGVGWDRCEQSAKAALRAEASA